MTEQEIMPDPNLQLNTSRPFLFSMVETVVLILPYDKTLEVRSTRQFYPRSFRTAQMFADCLKPLANIYSTTYYSDCRMIQLVHIREVCVSLYCARASKLIVNTSN